MGNRYKDRRQYFNELVETSAAYYVDHVRRFVSLGPVTRVLEIGCGEGGNLLPFARLGCDVTGMDLAAGKIENAKEFFREKGAEGAFFYADFFEFPLQDKPFDLILVHDVVEHIAPEDKQRFLERVREFLAPGGVAFFAFPAWQMPFGGHQQNCTRKPLRAPWIHLLPKFLYRGLLRLFKEPEDHVSELLDIYRSRMTVERFERLSKAAGFKVVNRTLWFINPHYKAKFGLNPVRLRLGLDRLPGLRNLFATSCWFVIG